MLSAEWPAALLKMHGTSHDMLRTLLLFHEAGHGGPMGGGPGGAIPAAAVPRPGFSSPSRSILGSVMGCDTPVPPSAARSMPATPASFGSRGIGRFGFSSRRHQTEPQGEWNSELTVRDLERRDDFSWCV